MRLVIRRGTILALALLMAAAAFAPSCLAACCSPSRDARIMAAMPCCAGAGPAVKARAGAADRPDATLVSASPLTAPLTVRLFDVAASPLGMHGVCAASPGWDTVGGAAPPIFLRDAQFRI